MKLEYPKDWFLRRAEIEGDSEVGVGIPPWNQTPGTAESRQLASRIAFGRFVELWRRNKGWDAEQLAQEAGLDAAEILEIERQAEPQRDTVLKLAKVFGVRPGGLLSVAGLAEGEDPALREKAIRFAARSAGVAALEPHEREALETFVSDLGESGDG